MKSSLFISLKSVLLTTLLVLSFTVVSHAQIEIGAQLNMRNIKPGFGYGGYAEIGIPTESSWRLAFRAYLAIFGAGVPEYNVFYHKSGSKKGELDASKNFAGTPMDAFDRGVGVRIYYQETEFQPFFGFGATYAYNDILSPRDTPEFDNIERTLNFDFTLGASYVLSENFSTFLEFHMANITRANLIAYESFMGLNFGISYRFGNNKFSNVYE